MTFRDGIVADLPTIVRLLADDQIAAPREDGSMPPDARYAAGFDRMAAQGGRLIVMLDGDAIVGCMQINIIHGVSALGQSVMQIEGVRVDKTRRGQGLGRLLMEYAVAQARGAGCATTQLTTRLERTEAQAFYTALGFVQSHAGFKRVV